MRVGHEDGELPVEERIGHLIKRAEQALISAKSRALRVTGLTVPQYAAMYMLAQKPGISGAELARLCLVTPQTMASVLTNLERKGLVHRETSSVHSKVLVSELTPAGHGLLRKADRLAVNVERALADAFTTTQGNDLRDLLGTAIHTLEKLNAQGQSIAPPAKKPGGP